AVWGYVAKLTGREFGILAWGVGAVVGTAIVRVAGRTAATQAVGVFSALLGVLVGKYLAYAFLTHDQLHEIGQNVGVLSGHMVRLFRHGLDDVFGWWDLLWVALAVGTAWVLLREQPATTAAHDAAPPPASLPSPTGFGGAVGPGVESPWPPAPPAPPHHSHHPA